MRREWPGPCFLKNVEVQGFDYEIDVAQTQLSVTMEHITLNNQRVCGLQNMDNCLAIRDLLSNNSVPAVISRGGHDNHYSPAGLVVLVDSKLQGGSPTSVAVESSAHLFIRNVVTSGYRAAIRDGVHDIASVPKGEHASQVIHSKFGGPSTHPLKLTRRKTMCDSNRRDFLKTSAAALSGVAILATPAVARAAASANDRVRVAIVGLGGRGRVSHCGALLELAKENVEIAALCDCDENRVNQAADEVEKRSGKRPTTFVEERKLLDDRSIDAVSLATPNHWHSLLAIWACQAGKDRPKNNFRVSIRGWADDIVPVG